MAENDWSVDAVLAALPRGPSLGRCDRCTAPYGRIFDDLVMCRHMVLCRDCARWVLENNGWRHPNQDLAGWRMYERELVREARGAETCIGYR